MRIVGGTVSSKVRVYRFCLNSDDVVTGSFTTCGLLIPRGSEQIGVGRVGSS